MYGPIIDGKFRFSNTLYVHFLIS